MQRNTRADYIFSCGNKIWSEKLVFSHHHNIAHNYSKKLLITCHSVEQSDKNSSAYKDTTQKRPAFQVRTPPSLRGLQPHNAEYVYMPVNTYNLRDDDLFSLYKM